MVQQASPEIPGRGLRTMHPQVTFNMVEDSIYIVIYLIKGYAIGEHWQPLRNAPRS